MGKAEFKSVGSFAFSGANVVSMVHIANKMSLYVSLFAPGMTQADLDAKLDELSEEELENLLKFLGKAYTGADSIFIDDIDRDVQAMKDAIKSAYEARFGTEYSEVVSLSDLSQLGWNKTDENGNSLDQQFIDELNEALNKYGITDPRAVELFLANVFQETAKGWYRYEDYTGGRGYDVEYRGGGSMQLTDLGDYQAYAIYLILQEYPDLDGLNYDGQEIKYIRTRSPGANDVAKCYEGIKIFAQEKGYDISNYTDIVDKGTPYVSDHYYWDSGAYDFAVAKDIHPESNGGEKLSDGVRLDEDFYALSDREKLDATVDRINYYDVHREKRHQYYAEIIESGLFRDE